GMEFNINSPQQLSYVLFEKLKLPTLKKTEKTKAFSTNVKVLNQLASGPHRLPKLILEYRTLAKLRSTYLDSLVDLINPKTGRLHTSFNQTVTATGRLSSSNPNLQNIPVRGEVGREMRKGFIAPEGFLLLSADYSQIELRIFAHYSEDPKLVEAFWKGEDIHERTAMEIFDLKDPSLVTPDKRRMAKAINFGIIYGMGPQKLSEELNIDIKLAKAYLEAYYERYPGVLRYRKETVEKARRDGYVTTLFNRRRYLPHIGSENKGLMSEAERAAINTPIQGTAADLIKKAMVNIRDRFRKEGLGAKILLQVHDELLFEVPEGELEKTKKAVVEEMEGVYRLKVPLKVDVGYGRNWYEAHP
ncbi:MAG: DNA polymerase, partial [Desulfatiglandales bacterium]